MKLKLAWTLFAASALCACVTPEPPPQEDVGEASQALVTTCEYLDPDLVAPLAPPVDYMRELMIIHPNVIDDPCRTKWVGGGACLGTRGVWTFSELMARMAGSVPAQVFVADWLHSWEVGHIVNGFPVPPRPGIRAAIIDPWLGRSAGCAPGDPIVGPGACPLDLKRAPFRLLGIVNRVDLSDAGFGATDPGELRFVFGATAGDQEMPTGALQFTVILEYKLPSQRGGVPHNAFDWATAFHRLSDPAATGVLGAPLYRDELQLLTDDVTSPGVEPGNPNFGSAIGTVRTNESAFGGPDWLMREYQLKPTGAGPNAMRLRLDPLDDTPDQSLMFSPGLDTYLFDNSLAHVPPSTALLDFTFVVPPVMLGGESPAPRLWNHSVPATLTPFERHHFGFATCNGCHTGETSTAFVHLAPRNFGSPTVLSPFLATPTTSAGGGVPSTVFTFADPAPTATFFSYNEPWRRVCEATRILNGDPTPYTRANGAH